MCLRLIAIASVPALALATAAPVIPASGRSSSVPEIQVAQARGLAAEEAPDDEASASCAERVVRAMQQRYEGIRDLSARFEQTTRSASMGGAPPSSNPVRRGQVLLAKPDRMRWAYDEPEASLVVSDGVTLWIYDPAAKEAQRLPAPKEYMSGAALQFLLGEGDLLKQFEVTARDCEAKLVQLELAPRQDASYERIGLAVDPVSGEVRATRLIDLLGNVTEVAFHDVRINTDPAPGRFQFRPPSGVQVIDLAPAEGGP